MGFVRDVFVSCAVLALAACSPEGDEPVASDALYTTDSPGNNLVPQHAVSGHVPVRRALLGSDGGRYTVTRELELDGHAHFLVVDDESLETALLPAADVLEQAVEATPTEAASWRLASLLSDTNDGVLCQVHDEHAADAGQQVAVTIDMCQSRKTWDRALYERLVELAELRGEPTPVGVALTGLWAQRHTAELAQLFAWDREGKLAITWINHSYHHQLSKDAAGHYHFLTANSVDLERGVLDLERLLIEQGGTPSLLFRFPGLTHDTRTLGELNALAVFPLDANGWMAKGEPVQDGSVVLLHGNGNEPAGVRMFLDWADANVDALVDGSIELVSPLEALPHSRRGAGACAP